MKTVVLVLGIFGAMLAQVASASPSKKVAVDPAITTMSIAAPLAGTDYPTDSATKMTAVLVLSTKRIAIYNDVPKIVKAKAGVDYPTDVPAPAWTKFQGILKFSNGDRIGMQLALVGKDLFWNTGKYVVDISDIREISRTEAGLDYPTDAPAADGFVLVLNSGTRLLLK